MNESKRTKAFLDEVVAVCRKHQLTISHEDYHGAFLVQNFDEANIEWLLAASDETKQPDADSSSSTTV